MDIIINTFGTSISKDNEAFIITTQEGKQRICPTGIKSIQISRGAQITSDAALLAIENEIEVLFIDRSGNPAGRIWSSKYGSVSTIRKGQLEFVFSAKAIDWIKDIIVEKIENQQALLLTLRCENEYQQNRINSAIRKTEDYRSKIQQIEGVVVPDIAATLRGWEGAAAKVYFETLNLFLPESHKMKSRSQHPALDLTNCMLNYSYGILYGKIEGALIKAGIDPYIGVFHRDDYNRPVLVYDIIEKYRVWADYVVYTLSIQEVMTEECFSQQADGSFWLENLGKRILIQSLNDYLDEIVKIKGSQYSRLFHLQSYAYDLANLFKKL